MCNRYKYKGFQHSLIRQFRTVYIQENCKTCIENIRYYGILLTHKRMLGVRIHAGQCTRASASKEDSGESAHMHRLARAFAARICEPWI